jgi:hypothetical protein
MTLNVITISPRYVVSVSDRRMLTPNGYQDIDDNRYKHTVLLTDDGVAVIAFAGFAGTFRRGGRLPHTTADWIAQTIEKTALNSGYTIEEHMNALRDGAGDYVHEACTQLQASLSVRLALVATGWVKGQPFNCVVDNCLAEHWTWEDQPRNHFTTRVRN